MPDDLVTRLAERLKERRWQEKPRLFAMGDLLEIRNELGATKPARYQRASDAGAGS
jgi:hypothetical protein